MSAVPSFDVALVGAGLANGLIAAAITHSCPHLRVLVVDERATLGSQKTWCFHAADVGEDTHTWQWLRPFVARQWPGYLVKFPTYERAFASAYHCIPGEHFGQVLTAVLRNANVRLRHACTISGKTIVLHTGERFEADVVLDGRGAAQVRQGAGYQKFVGWEIELQAESGLTLPVLMDARVAQVDGYRFVYVLPLGARHLLVEDTYFSSDAALNEVEVEERLRAYVAGAGWQVKNVVRVEKGVLPMPWAEQGVAPETSEEGVFEVGYKGGWFQPATGYSVPMAVAVAKVVAQALHAAPAGQERHRHVQTALATLRSRFGKPAAFYRLLNRLAFLGVHDEDRRGVFERFYRLPETLVARFYSGQTTWWDKARILGGKPPVPLHKFRLGRLMEEAT